MEILSTYPQEVIDRAVSPSRGLPGLVTYPNLAKFKGYLDGWRDDYFAALKRIQDLKRIPPPEPPRDLEAEKKIEQGLRDLVKHLSSGFSPGSI